MTSDSEGISAGDAVNLVEAALAAEVKPQAKARKKKLAEGSDLAEPEAMIDVAPAVIAAKPGKKAAARKAKPAAIAEAPAKLTPFKPRAATSGRKTERGRDLVVDSPGAQEIAEILHPSAPTEEETAQSEAPTERNAPEPKLERLQKILAKAGISSRRKAEELILGGRVQINGKIVMELGTKADPARDHVRVDGRLVQGPERIRYFVLNKPKGYVTTVSDPEGRPTVMQFFAGERERLYPVGRLDYLSEGLLLVTNDGELANRLTKASSGVEKTYLVKVAGQPAEEALEALRAGVVIERGRPGTGSGRVRTAPAQIRQVRQGDNPWYEVIVIEGRNRELRKMFEEIGHHVEKIRRVGYGPLILDLEPGKLRELDAEEVRSLRLASEGKLKTRRRRGPAPAQLPTVAGKTVRYKKVDGKPGFEPRFRRGAAPESGSESPIRSNSLFGPAFKKAVRPEFQQESKADYRPAIGNIPKAAFKTASGKPASRPAQRSKPGFAGRGGFAGRPRRVEPPVIDHVLPPRHAGTPGSEPDSDARPPARGKAFNPDYKPGSRAGGKPAFRSEGHAGTKSAPKPQSPADFRKDRPAKPFAAGRPGKPSPPAAPRADFVRRANPSDESDFAPPKTPGFRIEPVEGNSRGGRSEGPARGGKPFRPTGADRPFRPRTERSSPAGKPFRARTDGPPGGERAGSSALGPSSDRGAGRRAFRPDGEAKPFRPRTDRSRPFSPRLGGPPSRSVDTGEERSREYRPGPVGQSGGRSGGWPAKKSPSEKPASGPEATGNFRSRQDKSGPDGEPRVGQPRVKERWRNSFTGKNKGRPKPRPRKAE